jgi:hypothetical protein
MPMIAAHEPVSRVARADALDDFYGRSDVSDGEDEEVVPVGSF